MIEPGAFPGKVANFPLGPGDVVVMESSGGGGFGEPTERAAAAQLDDLADGYVTEGGRGPYQSAAPPVGVTADAAVAAKHCRMSPALGRALGADVGDLVELTAVSGPAMRLWIEAFDAALDEATVLAAQAGPHRIRRLSSRP